jgi:hypothetical protein
MSSVFLHREFGVEVWATDLWFSATDNLQCVRDAGISEGVYPIHAAAHALPFAAEFFDAIVSIDSFQYYGTDDTYTHYLARLLKSGGAIAIAGAGLMQEFDGEVPPVELHPVRGAPGLRIYHGLHRWRVSLALGFSSIPATIMSTGAAESLGLY